MAIGYLTYYVSGEVSSPNPLDGEFGSVLPTQKFFGFSSTLPMSSKFVSVPYSSVYAIWDEGSTGSNNRYEVGQWMPFWAEINAPDVDLLTDQFFVQFSFQNAPVGAAIHGQFVVAFHVE